MSLPPYNSMPGPIAQQVIAALRKEQNRKIIPFDALRLSAAHSAELERGVISEADMSRYDPLHAVYIYAQNKISVLGELLLELPACAKFAKAYAKAEDEYQPSGPPISPLTQSYFFNWAMFDSCVGQETIGTVAIDVCRKLEVGASLVRLFECLQNARMGLYVHEGVTGGQVLLRELVTGDRYRCIVPAGYMGQPGELWFVRVLSEPFETMPLGYSLVFNTPYVLGRLRDRTLVPADVGEWQAFLERTIPKTGLADTGAAYAQLMKYGLTANYWNEYVFEAYVTHRQDMILLAGFPDVSESRPHAHGNEV